MRILAAVDQHPYSAHVIQDVAKLAMNTWADVTLLGVGPKAIDMGRPSQNRETKHPLPEALRDYRRQFLGHFKGEISPYEKQARGYEFVEVKKGMWEELFVCRGDRKDLKILLRSGNPVKEILAQSYEDDSDLIVLGCYKKGNCQWEGSVNLPQKVANTATCSVLVVKEEKKFDRVVCCLDQESISQKSVELINQMVTLYQTELEVVGLTDKAKLNTMVAKKVDEILKYYTARKIKAWIKLVDISSLESFVSQEAKRSLMALWMGGRSVISKIFSRSKVDKLIQGSQSSVLLLR